MATVLQVILLVSMAISPAVAAGAGNPIRAQIAAPADGGSFARGEPIAFVDATTTSAECPIVNWTWKFDDGHKAYGERAVHVYEELREYRPSLHVVGACGHRHGAAITLAVHNAPPTAALAAPPAITAGSPFELNASGSRDGDGEIVEYRLTLDDEPLPTSTSPSWTIELTQARSYLARLVVLDDDGSESAPIERELRVAPAALAAISLAGPTTLRATEETTYLLSGRDAYGNSVPLARETLPYRAPEKVGSHGVAYAEKGVSGALAVHVVPAALALLELEGPRETAAGSLVRFAVHAFDAYRNAREPAQPIVEHIASTRAGDEVLCHLEGDVEGCATLRITAGPLATLILDGPREVVVAQVATFSAEGFDRYGNRVALSNASLAWTAPTRAGPARVTHEEQGVAGSLDVAAVADALSRIDILGPDQLSVGANASYSLRGSDAYGNDVPLSLTQLRLDAPTTPQQVVLTHEEQGVSGQRVVDVVPGPLARLVLVAPDSLAAAETATIALRGEDSYGNDVPLANTSFLYTAPTRAGRAVACHAEEGVSGCVDMLVVAGPLAAISLAGPATIIAGERAEYALHGHDRHGNDVPLSASSVVFLAPTSAGFSSVRYEEHGVRGELLVRVVADALARIDVTGPAELAAGSNATYRLRGFDRYANDVPLLRGTLVFQAPALAGPDVVRYVEAGVEGALAVRVVAGPLARLALLTPADAVVGAEVAIGLSGWDEHANPVELAPSTFSWRAPLKAGRTLVTHEIDGVAAHASILLVADALSYIDVDGPAKVRAGDVATFRAAGSDRHGNAVTLMAPTFDWRAPLETGPTQACTRQDAVTGCASVAVVPRVTRVEVAVSQDVVNVERPVLVAAAAYDDNGASVAHPEFDWTVDGGTLQGGVVTSAQAGTVTVVATSYGVSGSARVLVRTLLAVAVELDEDPTLSTTVTRGVRGNVTVAYIGSDPVVNATASVTVTRTGLAGEAWPQEHQEVVTDDQGRAGFGVALPSGLPGEYRIDVETRAGANHGTVSFVYTVRA